MQQIETQGLGPLAYRWASRPGAAPPPPELLARLSDLYTESMAAWLHRRSGLLALLDILAEPPAIPVIVLKGMALAISLYPDPALRPMNDIDLLAPADRFEEAVARLLEHGYGFGAHELVPGFVARFSHHAVLIEPETRPPLPIELHKTLPFLPAPAAAAVMTWFWQRQQPHVLAGFPIAVFDPTAQLLHLAVHLSYQHAGVQALLIWQHDIDLLWRRFGGEIDWDSVAAIAQVARWEAGLSLALNTTANRFGSPLPASVLAWLSTPRQQLSGYRTVNRLGDHGTRSLGMVETLRFLPRSQRPAYLLAYLIPSAAYMQGRYQLSPPWLLPLAYPYRWLDLALDLLRTLIHRP